MINMNREQALAFLDALIDTSQPEQICPNGAHCADGHHEYETLRDNNGRYEYTVGVACANCDVSIIDVIGHPTCGATGKAV